MKYAILFFFLCISSLCEGQVIFFNHHQKYLRIKKDTIHIRGVVVDEFNNPASDFFVVSKNKEIEFYGLPLYTKTDSAGKFELDGALVTDTLEVWWNRKKFSILNNGSRYLEITLPGTLIDTVNIPGSVTAKRVVRKKASPVFKVLMNAEIADYFGLPYFDLPRHATPPDGFRKFQNMVNQQIIYPEKAIKNNIEGEVKIGFSIGTDGTLGDFHVIKGIGYGCEDAVIAAIKTSSKWNPAGSENRPLTSYSSVTINFKLTDN